MRYIYISSGPIPNDTIESESGKFQNDHEQSKGDSSLRNIPWSDKNSNSTTERTSSAQSVATTGTEKPNHQSVEKAPSQDGCAGINNGPFFVPKSSKSSISEDARLPQVIPQKVGVMKQSVSAEVQDAKDSPPVQVSKCKYVEQFTGYGKPVNCTLL